MGSAHDQRGNATGVPRTRGKQGAQDLHGLQALPGTTATGRDLAAVVVCRTCVPQGPQGIRPATNVRLTGLVRPDGHALIRDPDTAPQWHDISMLPGYPHNGVREMSFAGRGDRLNVILRGPDGTLSEATCRVIPTPGSFGNPAWPANCQPGFGSAVPPSPQDTGLTPGVQGLVRPIAAPDGNPADPRPFGASDGSQPMDAGDLLGPANALDDRAIADRAESLPPYVLTPSIEGPGHTPKPPPADIHAHGGIRPTGNLGRGPVDVHRPGGNPGRAPVDVHRPGGDLGRAPVTVHAPRSGGNLGRAPADAHRPGGDTGRGPVDVHRPGGDQGRPPVDVHRPGGDPGRAPVTVHAPRSGGNLGRAPVDAHAPKANRDSGRAPVTVHAPKAGLGGVPTRNAAERPSAPAAGSRPLKSPLVRIHYSGFKAPRRTHR